MIYPDIKLSYYIPCIKDPLNLLNFCFWFVQSHLQPQFDIVTKLHAEVSSALDTLSAHMATPSLLPHTPPVATKLLWLKALRERVSGPMEKVREVAPYLLEGDQGWKLRQLHGQALTKIDE